MGVITSAVRMLFPRYPSRWTLLGRLGDERDYSWLVGDGTNSPLVETLIAFIVHGFTQMQPVVRASEPNEIETQEIMAAHPAAQLFRRPTYDPDLGRSWYSWMTLISGVLISFIADGNAYLIKRRSASGRTVQLWYVPHWMIEPRWDINDPSKFITVYDYAYNGSRLSEGPVSVASLSSQIAYPLRVEDVIHLRDGLDPQNVRKGRSKLKKLLREIYTDEEAARWTASLLRNNGVPGVVLSPGDSGWVADKDEVEEMKDRLRVDFTGDRRGEPIIMRGPTKVEQYGFSPEQMKLGDLRDIPEERISAALGVPAAVAGFGAGLQSTKVGATMAELVDLAWQNGILPRATIIAAELTEQYLSEWEPETAALTRDFAFDTSRVPIMAEYHKTQAERHEILFRASIEQRGEARRAVGLSASPRDKVYALQAGTAEVPADKTLEEAPATAPIRETERASLPEAGPTADANGNHNGGGHAAAAIADTKVIAQT